MWYFRKYPAAYALSRRRTARGAGRPDSGIAGPSPDAPPDATPDPPLRPRRPRRSRRPGRRSGAHSRRRGTGPRVRVSAARPPSRTRGIGPPLET